MSTSTSTARNAEAMVKVLEALARLAELRWGAHYSIRHVVCMVEDHNGRQRWLEIDPTFTHLQAANLKPEARHSPDFHSVWWFGSQHTFTHLQANIVKVLWAAWQNDTPDVGIHYLLERAGSDRSIRRVDSLFKDHPAWGTMIISKTKGSYRLQAPETNTEEQEARS